MNRDLTYRFDIFDIGHDLEHTFRGILKGLTETLTVGAYTDICGVFKKLKLNHCQWIRN